MTEIGFGVISPEMKVTKCKGGFAVTFLAESSGQYCILFSHRLLHNDEGPLSFEKPISLLVHLADSLFVALDSIMYPDYNSQDVEWFSSQKEALDSVIKMWR